jgi:xylan 1,4-beta-xylosidase
MKKVLFVMAVLGVFITSVDAATVAYWRFEEGPANANVSHGGQADGIYYEGTADSSGNGYGLSVWAENWAGYAYKTDRGAPSVSGQANNFSVKNSGGYPAMFTSAADGINGIQPAAFTIEASFKLENGDYRTIVGRDSRGSATVNGDLAAMYFQAMPNNVLAIKFCDVAGYWHEALSAANAFTGFNWGSNPDGIGVPWYSMAGVSDGSVLSLYLRNMTDNSPWALIAQTDMTVVNPSPNTALTKGTGSAGDWQAGNFSVGRGLYAGGHGDRAYGFIDEVRISDSALAVNELLIPEPATMLLLGLGTLLTIRKRK